MENCKYDSVFLQLQDLPKDKLPDLFKPSDFFTSHTVHTWLKKSVYDFTARKREAG
jgi:hypothetical protein